MVLVLDKALGIAIITAIRLVVLLSVEVVLGGCHVRHLNFVGGLTADRVRLVVHLAEELLLVVVANLVVQICHLVVVIRTWLVW